MPLTNCPVCKLGTIVSDEDREQILICERCGSIIKQTVTGYIFTRVAREFHAEAEKYMNRTFTEDELIELSEEIAIQPQDDDAASPVSDADVSETVSDKGAGHKPDLDRLIHVEESNFDVVVRRFMMPFILGFLLVILLLGTWRCGSYVFRGRMEGYVDEHKAGAVVPRQTKSKLTQRNGKHEGIECPVCKKKFK